MTRTTTLRTACLASTLLAALLAGCGGEKPETLMASGKAMLAKQDVKGAIIQFKNVLQREPNSGEARFLLGKSLLDGGDAVGAEVELRKAAELKFDPGRVMPALASAVLRQGQAKKVVDEFGKLQLAAGEPAASLKTIVSSAHLALNNQDAAQTALAEALASKPDFIPARLEEARRKAAANDLAGAQAVVADVLAKSPANYDALLLMGTIVGESGDKAGALGHYRKAIEARSDFLPAHSAVIASLLLDDKIDEAAAQLEVLKKVAPGSIPALYLSTQIAYQRKDFKAARDQIQTLLKAAPNNPAALQLAGAIEFQSGDANQAEAHLNKALQLAPDLLPARRLLIAAYLRGGQTGKALSTLQPVLDKLDGDPQLLTQAGEIHLQTGDTAKAEDYLARANKLDPGNPRKRTSLALVHLAKGDPSAFLELEQISAADSGVTADLALISAYLRRNELDKALKAIDVLERKRADDPASHNLRARTLLAKRDVSGARKSFEKALAINPAFTPAAAGLATLDMAEKKPAEARKRFEAVLAASPKNMAAMLALAQLSAATGGTSDEVGGLIGQAVAANPGEVAPRLALVDHHLRAKDAKKAVAAAQEALAALPDRPELLDAGGRALQAAGDLNQALATYGKLALIQPNSALAPMRMAEIHLAGQNKDEAGRQFKKALELQPGLVEAQRALARLAVEANRPQQALTIAYEVQKQRPAEPAGYLLEADIQLAGKNLAEAIAIYRRGLKQAPSPELAVRLHDALLRDNAKAEADKTAAAWLKEHPRDIAMRAHLGDLATARKDYAAAAQHYRGALEIAPENALVLNNLAWVSGQLKSAKAIEYAEKANQLAPNQPPFMDTLAMLLADKGDTARAVELLRKALSINPKAYPFQLNLAKVLLKAGRKDEARKELSALGQLGDKFQDHEEAARMLKGL
jgi:putative PEP-CTERM system TPR-repeat lipoprotein